MTDLSGYIAIPCPTFTEAVRLLEYLQGRRFWWHCGDPLSNYTHWENYAEETVYFIDNDNKLSYADTEYLTWYNGKYRILRVSDITSLTADDMYADILHKE